MIAMGAHPAVRFAAVGAINTIAGLTAIVLAARLFGAGTYVANAAGLLVGIIIGHELNRRWTFSSLQRRSSTAPRYVLAFAASYLANLAVLVAAQEWLATHPMLGQAAALASYSTVFYLACRFFVFRATA